MPLIIRYMAIVLVAVASGSGFAVAQDFNAERNFNRPTHAISSLQEPTAEPDALSASMTEGSASSIITESDNCPDQSQRGACNQCNQYSKCRKCANKSPEITVYGFVQADYIQDFNRMPSDWESTLRPSRIPTIDGEYGSDGSAHISARQTRFGVDGLIPTECGPIKTKFEFDLFGVGDDEGQTTFRLRHAYGELGNWLAGQTHSLFMDIDVFPNTIDYWGPCGMVFLRTPQIRWQPIQGRHYFAVSVEHPGSAIDTGRFNRVIQDLGLDVQPVERFADVATRYRLTLDNGTYAQVASIIRPVGFETIGTVDNFPREEFTGWGVNFSGNIKVGDRGDRIIGQYVFGKGIANYMNDGGVDIAPRNAVAPADPALEPLRGIVFYYDHHWNDRFSSALGYSHTEVDNFAGQSDDAFRRGKYVSANLLFTPAENVLMGVEYLWGSRKDNDGATGEDNRLQISFKYSF